MAVNARYISQASVTETLSESLVPAASAASGRQVTHSGFNTATTIDATTDVPASKVAAYIHTIDGTDKIDLTALTGTSGVSVDGSGLKVQIAKIKAPTDNAAVITIDVGDANGYNFAGAAFSVALLPGQEFLFFGNDAAPDVAGADAELDLVGTNGDTLEIIIVLG